MNEFDPEIYSDLLKIAVSFCSIDDNLSDNYHMCEAIVRDALDS